MSIKTVISHSTTNIGKDELKTLNKLATSAGVKNINYLNAAIHYFKKTGINPFEPELSPKDEIIKLQKRNEEILKFIRVFEKEKLSPLLERLIMLERRIGTSIQDMPLKSELSREFHLVREELKRTAESSQSLMIKYKEPLEKVSQVLNQFNFEQKKAQNMIKCLFEALKNKGIGNFKDIDIKNFNDAVNKVRSI